MRINKDGTSKMNRASAPIVNGPCFLQDSFNFRQGEKQTHVRKFKSLKGEYFRLELSDYEMHEMIISVTNSLALKRLRAEELELFQKLVSKLYPED